MKLSQLAIGIFLIVIVALFIGPFVGGGTDPAEMLQQAPLEVPMDEAEYSETWGAKQPRVTLQAYLPRGNAMAERVIQAFHSVIDASPTDVRAEVIDMSKPSVAEIMAMRGVQAPLVAVNSKLKFEVVLDGQKRTVSLDDLNQLRSLPLEKVLRAIVAQELKTKPANPASGR